MPPDPEHPNREAPPLGDPGALEHPPEPPPTLPGRGAYLAVFTATVLAGFFGGVIGWGVTDIGCTGNCTVVTTTGALVGAIGAAVGVGVVGVLVLRAMAEWRHKSAAPGEAEAQRPSDPDDPA